MIKYKVQLSALARNDFKNIISYIKNELLEPSIAKRMSDLLINEMSKLSSFPQKFSFIDYNIIKDLKFRKLIVKNYIIFYRINEAEKVVNVERILHGSTNWINKL